MSKQFCSDCKESDLEYSESFLPSFFAIAKLTRQDAYTLAVWFIYSVCAGVSAQGFGKEGEEGGRVQTKHLNVIPLMVQLWEGNYLRLFCYDISGAAGFYCPLVNMLQKQRRNHVSTASLSPSHPSCLQSGPLFYVHPRHQPRLHFPPSLWPHLFPTFSPRLCIQEVFPKQRRQKK